MVVAQLDEIMLTVLPKYKITLTVDHEFDDEDVPDFTRVNCEQGDEEMEVGGSHTENDSTDSSDSSVLGHTVSGRHHVFVTICIPVDKSLHHSIISLFTLVKPTRTSSAESAPPNNKYKIVAKGWSNGGSNPGPW
eukprot:gene28473-35328_t